MARMRYVKPEFWTDSVIVNLSFEARLLYIGTWNFALCDHGHLEDDALQLKMKVFPADNVDVPAVLAELVTAGRIARLTGSDGRRYLHIVRLDSHQKTDPRFTPRCPACNDNALTSDDAPSETLPSLGENSRTLPIPPVPSDSLPQEGKGGEGKGREGKGVERAASRGTRIPDDFTPDEPMTLWAKENAPDVDITLATAEFVDYWRGVAGQKGVRLDWVGVWRNNMRKKQEWAASRPPGLRIVPGQPSPKSPWDTAPRIGGQHA